jgi:hypothetical protein
VQVLVFGENEVFGVASAAREGDGVDGPAIGEALRLRVREVPCVVGANAEAQQRVVAALRAEFAFCVFADSENEV